MSEAETESDALVLAIARRATIRWAEVLDRLAKS